METQKMQTPGDKFKELLHELYLDTKKIGEKLSTLQSSSIVKLPKVQRNLELARRNLEDMQNRLRMVDDILSEYPNI